MTVTLNDIEDGILQDDARWDAKDREWKFRLRTADSRLLYCTSTALMRTHFWDGPFPATKGGKVRLKIHTVLLPDTFLIEDLTVMEL
jgi:hypothetical protein